MSKAMDNPVREHTILFVDDEPLILEAAQTFLSQAGFSVHAFDHPRKALDACHHLPTLSCAVIDLDLPELPGLETYEQLSPRYPGLPVIFTSGYDRPIPETPYQRFISKPFRFEAMVSAIHTIITPKREPKNA